MLSTNAFGSGRACFPHRAACGSGGLPVGRQQDAQIVLIAHGGKPLEHIGQPGFGIVAGALCALGHRGNGSALDECVIVDSPGMELRLEMPGGAVIRDWTRECQ